MIKRISFGFTLVELMTVVAIVGMLVALAVPSYVSSVRKGRRADAQAELIQFASAAERIRTQTDSYATAVAPTNTAHYTYTFPVALSANAYTIQATPSTAQSKDRCGTMTLSHTGERKHTGDDTTCW